MQSRLCAIACSRTAALVWVSEPKRYDSGCPGWSWKVFEFTASKPSPSASACSRSAAWSDTQSQGKCGETRGVQRTRRWITAQSSSFSNTLRGSAGPGKRAKRVPPVPTPQLGTATAKAAARAVIASMSTPERASCAPSVA